MKKYAGKNTINFLTKLFGNEVVLLRNEIDELKERVSLLENNSGSGGTHTHEFVDGVCTVCGINIGELANWAYQLNETDKSIILTNYIGSESDVTVRSSYAIGEDVYDTTIIGICLFKDCTGIQTITFEEGIEIVSYNGFSTNNMFSGCTSLTTINGLENVNMSNVSDMNYMFYNCSSLNALDLSMINVDNATSMQSMFAGCTSLTSLNVTNWNTSNVTNMREMFNGCTLLTEITGLENLDVSNVEDMSYLFFNDNSLESLDLTKWNVSKVTNMKQMFSGCASLTEISASHEGGWDINEECDTSYMFYDCGCENVTIIDHNYTSSITTEPTCEVPGVRTYTCSVCGDTYTEDIDPLGHTYVNGVCTVCGAEDPNYIEPSPASYFDTDGAGTIKWLTSEGQKATEIVIPTEINGEQIIALREQAFNRSTYLESVTIPGTIKTISKSAFNGCSKLASVTICEGVEAINGYAFGGCTSLTEINIPSSVKNIGEYAFDGCTKLTSIVIPEGVETLGNDVFYNCNLLTDVTLPNTITSMGEEVFENCKALKSIVFPEGITTLGTYTFKGCTALTSVTLPSTITTIGKYVFDGCTALLSIAIPEGITTIDQYAFCNCKALESIIIPVTLTTINASAFYNCYVLATVNYRGTEEQWNAISINTSSNTKLINATKVYNYTAA